MSKKRLKQNIPVKVEYYVISVMACIMMILKLLIPLDPKEECTNLVRDV